MTQCLVDCYKTSHTLHLLYDTCSKLCQGFLFYIGLHRMGQNLQLGAKGIILKKDCTFFFLKNVFLHVNEIFYNLF